MLLIRIIGTCRVVNKTIASQTNICFRTITTHYNTKAQYKKLTSSILEGLRFFPSALWSQRVSVLKTNTVPLSFLDLKKPLSSSSALISLFLSHIPLNDPPDAPALIDSEWQYIYNSNSFLAKLKLEKCATCKERWFDMKLSNKVCKACRSSNIQKKLYSKSNNSDVGFIPHNLPSLSEIEEILIARVYVPVQVRQIKG